eukprot:6207899-Pleurochrysis_carterae.AAC.2
MVRTLHGKALAAPSDARTQDFTKLEKRRNHESSRTGSCCETETERAREEGDERGKEKTREQATAEERVRACEG